MREQSGMRRDKKNRNLKCLAGERDGSRIIVLGEGERDLATLAIDVLAPEPQDFA